MKRKYMIILGSTAVILAALLGGMLSLHEDNSNEFTLGRDNSLPCLTFYTTGLATTPQLPFWHAVTRGKILEKCRIRVKIWKNLDDLRGILLAGKGDLWLGHTDGFVQAARKGAPIKLLITTGWKKFYLVSTNPEMKALKDFIHKPLAFAPPGSPVVPILKAIAPEIAADIIFQSHEPRQLAMKLLKGDLETALLPEPLVTGLLQKVRELRVVLNVEEIYGQHTGHPPRMPIAGLAVNARTAQKYPELVSFLVSEVMAHGRQLEQDPHSGITSLPEPFEPFISKVVAANSLERDMVKVELSHTVQREIQDYLAVIQPNPAGADTGGKSTVPDSFFWK